MITINHNLAAENVESTELFSFFAGERNLSRYLNKLANAGIYTIGDMKAVSDQCFFSAHPTSDGNQARIQGDLSRIGVHIA